MSAQHAHCRLDPRTTPASAAEEAFSDTDLLVQLVQALAKRSDCTLLLSDLGALLPEEYRQCVKTWGGLRRWLQSSHWSLFRVAGEPGQEKVTLMFGEAAYPAGADASAAEQGEEDVENETEVQLRGLPYSATIADIKNFLGSHTEFLRDDHTGQAGPIQLVLRRDGRPSGFARVQFTSLAAAKAARNSLHRKWIDMGSSSSGPEAQSRYVETFLFSERPNKLRFKKSPAAVADGATVSNDEDDTDPLGIQNQVYEECKALVLEKAGKGELLLSMLGVSLSQESRQYLNKTDRGLKDFLSHYPEDFMFGGLKGCESVRYRGQGELRKDANLSVVPAEEVPGDIPCQARRLQKVAEGPPAHESPKPEATDSPMTDIPRSTASARMGMVTPSNWASPHPVTADWDPQAGGQKPQAGGSEASVEDARDGSTPMCPIYCEQGPHLGIWSQWGSSPPWAPGTCWDPILAQLVAAGVVPSPPWAFEHALAARSNLLDVPVLPRPPILVPGAGASAGDAVAAQATAPDDANCPAAVHLRGLPLDATEQDVLSLFSRHNLVEFIEAGHNKVRLIPKLNGKPSGRAVVWMQSYTHACKVLQELHGQHMRTPDITETGYIEVSHHEEVEGSIGGAVQGNAQATAPPGRGRPGWPHQPRGRTPPHQKDCRHLTKVQFP